MNETIYSMVELWKTPYFSCYKILVYRFLYMFCGWSISSRLYEPVKNDVCLSAFNGVLAFACTLIKVQSYTSFIFFFFSFLFLFLFMSLSSVCSFL